MTRMTFHSSAHIPSRRLVLAGLATATMLALPRATRAALKPADQLDLGRIQSYLNGIHTMESQFDQVGGDGSTATGTIYISRPGHMRIVYNPPHPILIVATNDQVYYYDAALGQVTWTDLDNTPAWFLLQSTVELGGPIRIDGVQHTPGAIRVSATEVKRPERGRVTMVFSDAPLQLRQWTILDAQNKTVTVTLDSPRFGVKLNPSLFEWENPQNNNVSGG